MTNSARCLKVFVLVCVSSLSLLSVVSLPESDTTGRANQPRQRASEQSPAIFEGKDTLLRPDGYREWVFVGSSTGLSYMPSPAPPSATSRTDFKNVYINPAAYREFTRTGNFPEGTVMILEIASAAEKNEPGLQGSYASKYIALEASVKDSKRFPGGWAYFGFTDPKGNLLAKAKPFPEVSCLSCHQKKAATDHVFTQFYPVLNTAKSK